MKTETKNENQLIWVDEENLKNAKLQLVKIESRLNMLVLAGEKVLKRLFTNEEKQLVRAKGYKFIDDEVRKLFKFPGADDAFNLKALGIDLKEAKQYMDGDWIPYDFKIDSYDLFVANEEQSAFKHFYHYADTDKKRAAVRIAEDLVKLSEDAKEFDLIQAEFFQMTARSFYGIIEVAGDVGRSNATLKVNYEGIAKHCR